MPEAKRKDFPAEAKINTDMKLARWVVANVSRHLHPDVYTQAPKAKQIEMGEISTLLNKVVNKLKGLD